MEKNLFHTELVSHEKKPLGTCILYTINYHISLHDCINWSMSKIVIYSDSTGILICMCKRGRTGQECVNDRGSEPIQQGTFSRNCNYDSFGAANLLRCGNSFFYL